MTEIRLCEACIHCLIKKFTKEYPEGVDERTKLSYIQGVLACIARADIEMSAPEIVAEIQSLQEKLFGPRREYTDIKRHFNLLLLSMEEALWKKISESDHPLLAALQHAMMGNYIDFGAVENVTEEALLGFMQDAENIVPDKAVFEALLRDLENGKKLIYLTDNCGEIVLDKLFLRTIVHMYPHLEVKAIVRGFPVLNDATMEDAEMIGLSDVVPVLDNGSPIAGTCLGKISKEAEAEIESADLILAKGQGNFETLLHSGKNIYYIFMCKCLLFAERFGVPQYTGMLKNERLMAK